MSRGWIGVDLDGTLAYYDHWRGAEHVGPPVPFMLERVRNWLAEGREVRIFTARVAEEDHQGLNYFHGSGVVSPVVLAIWRWCDEVGLPQLPVTCRKDYAMVELWDDRCVQVVPNTGRSLAEEYVAEMTALRGKP